jgi:folate-binding protein YgfZ
MTPVVHSNEVTLVYLAGNVERYLIICPKAQLTEQMSAFNLPIFSESIWQLIEICEGVPLLSASSIGEFVPQMLNVQAIHGISFTKGCYLGQETVARMQYLGKNKRALFALIGSAETVAADMVIEKQLGEQWKRAGIIQNSYTADNETVYIQAVLTNDIEADAVLRLKDQPNSQFSIQPLPYSLTTQENS